MSSSESTAPLLRPRHDSLSPTSLSTLLTRATSRRGPSVLVRQTAARQLELRRAEWGYSAPVVALDVTWNLAFVFASLAVMAWSWNEEPCVPVRIWIGGYALQCVVHVVIVCAEYRRRTESRGRREGDDVANRENESEEEEESNSSQSRHVFLSSLLTRTTSCRGPSVLVRQTAARQLELRRAEWGYSAPVVAQDVTWNLAFVFASLAVMAWSWNEEPCVPVRVWIGGYALQCVVHVVIVCAEYRRRIESRGRREGDDVANRENENEEEEEANSSQSRRPLAKLRRAEWGYSAPVVALDVTWNLVFVFASLAVMAWSWNEERCVPVRVWIGGYALQCVVHVVIVCAEYRRRTESGGRREGDDVANRENESEEEEEEANSSRSSFVKRCESINTMVSFLWWIVGFYWVVSGGDALLQSAPRLYWLAVVFLAFDVFFAIFCVVLACLIGIALCCCLPCIIAILYAVAGQEGASDADLSILPKYKFYLSSNEEKTVVGGGRMVPVETSSAYLANERVLLPEDAECCICLTAYEDGAELHALPCSHHFHSSCIVKWLKMNATCPLCKYDILKGSEQV